MKYEECVHIFERICQKEAYPGAYFTCPVCKRVIDEPDGYTCIICGAQTCKVCGATPSDPSEAATDIEEIEETFDDPTQPDLAIPPDLFD